MFNNYTYYAFRHTPEALVFAGENGFTNGCISTKGDLYVADRGDAPVLEIPESLIPPVPKYAVGLTENWPVMTHQEARTIVKMPATSEGADDGFRDTRAGREEGATNVVTFSWGEGLSIRSRAWKKATRFSYLKRYEDSHPRTATVDANVSTNGDIGYIRLYNKTTQEYLTEEIIVDSVDGDVYMFTEFLQLPNEECSIELQAKVEQGGDELIINGLTLI